MGLFDFLKKKPADEKGNVQGGTQAAPNPAAQKQSAPLNTEEIYGEYDAELKMYVSRISADQKKEIL